MPTRISKALGVSHAALIAEGAFDGFIDVDSLLYVDPHLLARTRCPELAGAVKRFEGHFRDVLRLLRASKSPADVAAREAARRLQFPELSNTGLGYSKGGVSGRAIGSQTAKKLAGLAKQIVDLGIEDPELFSLLGLLQEGVGPDLISDMTVSIIAPDLYAFSARVATKLGTRTVTVGLGNDRFRLPATEGGRPLVLVPADLLRKLPVAHSWDDVDMVASKNAALRRRVNDKIGDTWKRATGRSVKKKELRDAVLRHPELLRDMLEQYRAKKATGYDFSTDPEGVQVWYEVAEELSATLPLDLSSFKSARPQDLFGAVMAICNRFKEAVEANRLGRILYNDDGSPRKERTAQLFFFALASLYCDANDIDISPEADAGAGPVDFKFSRGARAKVTVEVKLSSNRNLVHGFEEQLPAYNRAENTDMSILLVVINGDHSNRLATLRTAEDAARRVSERVPQVIVIDGRPRESASKRRRRAS